jgi:hypothetical protein
VKDGKVAADFQPSDDIFFREFLPTARCPAIFCKFLLLLHWENSNLFNALDILIASGFVIYATSYGKH